MADQKNEFDSLDEMTSHDEDFDFEQSNGSAIEDEFNETDFDFDSAQVDAQSITDDQDDFVNGDEEDMAPVSNPENTDDANADEGAFKEKSFIQKNLLLIIMGVIIIPVLIYFIYWMTTPPTKNVNQTSVKRDQFSVSGSQFNAPATQNTITNNPVNRNENNGAKLNNPNNLESTVDTPMAQKSPSTIVQGMSEDDVIEMVEPLVEQIKSVSVAINNINQYLSEQESKIVEAKFGENDLKVIKDAINAGLNSTESFLLKKIQEQKETITSLSSRISRLESKKDEFESRRPLTMITASEGKAIMKITGTDTEFSIVNGETLKGYGVISRVGPWGCLHLKTGEKFQPENASCAE